jgi:outer membrane lipopolysaccharide assembly protein LptE/RlpB
VTRLTQQIGFAVLVLSLLSACGFQLRGSHRIADQYQPLNLVTPDMESAQRARLRSQLARSAELSDTTDANRLRVELETLPRQNLSGSGNSSVQLIQVGMRLSFGIVDSSGRELLDSQQLERVATVELDTDNTLADRETIERALSDLERSIIRAMIDRLRQ